MNYNITNKYRQDVMSQIYFFSLKHLSAYTAITGRIMFLMGGTQLLHVFIGTSEIYIDAKCNKWDNVHVT
jgi:hypothetical protein